MYTLIVICTILLSTTNVVQSKYVYRPQINGWLAQHKVIETWENAYKKCRNEGHALLASPISPEFLYEMRSMIGRDDFTSYYIGTSAAFYPGDQFVSIEVMLYNAIYRMLRILPLNTARAEAHREKSQYHYAGPAPVGRLVNSFNSIYPQKYYDELRHAGFLTRFNFTGVPLEDMPVSSMIKQIDSLVGNCLSMNQNSINVVPCSSRLPYWCYKKEKENLAGSNLCDNGYILNLSTGSCYKLHYEAVNWDQAYSACVSEGGHLAIIDNEQEAQVIHNLTSFMPDPYVFIGLRDKDGTGDWMSVHGQLVEEIYNDWVANGKTASPYYKCGRILNTGKLDSCTCTYTRAFLCEKDPYNNSLYHSEE